jgi:predicted NBD/HSP70 family sugar kinase
VTRPRLAAGLDIGGTKTLAVAVDRQGAILGRARLATDARDGESVARSAVAAVEALAAEIGRPTEIFEVIGAGLPGWVLTSSGTVSHALNLGVGHEPVAIAAHIARLTGVPTVVENDANAAAVGASMIMACGDLAYLSIGTGVAAGLLLDGQLRRGALGIAGEIGHLPLDPTGPLCECGQRGCLETVASGAAIGRRWPSASGQAATLLFEAAAAGDAAAIRIVSEVAGHLAAAVVTLTLTLDPALVVLGGGVAEVGPPLLESVQAAVSARVGASGFLASLDIGGRLRLVPDGLPVGALGAALLAWPRFVDDVTFPAMAGGGG